jgi:hypothetical protein
MLPKKTLLISAALTAFVLVMLTGVAAAFKQPDVPVVNAAALPTVKMAPTATAAATATEQVAILSPQEAATAAAQFLNRQDLYSVESASVNGTLAYKVTFSAGQIAYVGLDGQILSVTKIKPKVIVQANSNPARSSSAPAAPSSSSSGEHDSGENDD